MHQLGDHVGQPQLLGRQLVRGDLPQHHRDVATLLENRDAEASLVAKGEPKVRRPRLLQLPLAALRRDALHQRHGVLRLQHLGLQLAQPAVQAKHRRLADRDVNIAGPLLHAGHQQFVDQNLLCHQCAIYCHQ